jgi:sn-glycerol 3-phosphate transport system ATP-binding protein
MRVEIKRLQRRLKTTSIYVTHDQVEAMTMADRLVVMNLGVAEQIGTPLDVYEKPATMFVAGFIGSPSMNFMPARLADSGRTIDLGGGVALPVTEAVLGAEDGHPVMLGIRPEHLQQRQDKTADTLEVAVDLVEMLGADTLVYGTIQGTEAHLTARLPGVAQARPGDMIYLRPADGEVHLFDRETEKRLN